MSDLPASVLFACTFNSVRSPMAEGLMKRFHAQRIFVDSVGVHRRDIDPFTVAVMEEIGIDVSRHRAKTFEDLEDESYDVVISLSPHAQHKAVEMTRHVACDVWFWNTFDPSDVEGAREVRLQAYRDVRDELERRILKAFPVANRGAF